MRKLMIATAMILAATTIAEAQNRNGYNGYNGRGGYGGGHNRNVYVQNNYYGRRGGNWNNGGAWAAGLGGLALGAILGGALAAPAYGAPAYGYAQPNCQNVIVLYPDGTRGTQVVCN